MSGVILTEREAERLVALPKLVTGDVRWARSANPMWGKAEVAVLQAGTGMSLRATVNLDANELFSFALLVGNLRVRGLCANADHGNKHPDNRDKLYEVHLHIWTDRCRDRLAVPVQESVSANLSEALVQFCSMSNIDFQGAVESIPPFQTGMGI